MSRTFKPPTRYQRWWRRVLWHRYKLAALCAAVATFAILEVVRPAAPATVDLLTASHELTAGSRLRAEDVVAVPFPRNLVPEGSITRFEDLDGHSPTARIARGTPITRAGLIADGWTHRNSGRTAVAVHLADSTLANLLRPGQRIQLLAVDPRTPETAETLVSDAVVLAVPEADSRLTAAASGRLVVFEVPTDSARLVASSAVSRHLTVTWGD